MNHVWPQSTCFIWLYSGTTLPPWPGDIKKLTYALQSELTTWYVLTRLYLWGFLSRSVSRQVIFIYGVYSTHVLSSSVELTVTVAYVKIGIMRFKIQANPRILSESKQEMYYRRSYRQATILINRCGSKFLKTIRILSMFLQQNKLTTWLFQFQSKRISMLWTVTTNHVVSNRESAWDGLWCNIWIVSNDLVRKFPIRNLILRVEDPQNDGLRVSWSNKKLQIHLKNLM